MSKSSNPYAQHRFPPQVISHAVWLYHRFTLSFRDIEELLAIRGIQTSYESIRRWCLVAEMLDIRPVSLGMQGSSWRINRQDGGDDQQQANRFPIAIENCEASTSHIFTL